MSVTSRPGFDQYTLPPGSQETMGRGLWRYQNCSTGGVPFERASHLPAEVSFSRRWLMNP
jgi:hypothetical protein